MKRELPIFNINGTEFIVDVENLQLREKNNDNNVISFLAMNEMNRGYQFIYNTIGNNMSIFAGTDQYNVIVNVPELVDLDPVGMAQKYGCKLEEVKSKTDFDLMVDQKALNRRMSGILPTINIEGDLFYVDVAKDCLRPADDFISNGISFTEIEERFDEERNAYVIPYDKQKKEYQKLDYENITAIPKDLVVVAFPAEYDLDPIGFNRKYRQREFQTLKEVNVRSHFKADVVSWEEFGMVRLIEENLKKQKPVNEKMDDKADKKQRRSRRL
ncbi:MULTISPECIES: hypothetical protein [unclassified Flavobacterium]|uniref:hypothetical protein n=1 Tax=unclassified Flavobacterium TaxID=196869 RepID=UPI000961CF99|nr:MULTISPECIES: hypothetical protein [unclassified Flavobacterium]MBN9284121.1 hypothetical protein [Flavobacterium sp.]OJV71135.1 MAG: hypothetical protein BGO42_04805 [Flavobacterium sp. 40-81]